MPDTTDKRAGRTAKRIDALAAAALSDLGQRGAIDAGTRTLARGGTRERVTSTVSASVWYAWSERDGCYNYAPSWTRQPTDTLRSPERVRVKLSQRSTVALPAALADPDAPRYVADDGTVRVRAARGAIVGTERPARSLWTVTTHAVPAVARTAARSRVASLAAHGVGL